MKNIRMFTAVLLTFITLTHSRPSQAAVSIFTGGATALVGLKVIAVGAVGGIAGTYIGQATCGGRGECFNGLLPFLLGAVTVAVGVVILDGDQTIEFNSLSTRDAALLGVSKRERLSFNEELDQVNMLLEEVSAEMADIKDPTAELSVAAWHEVKDLVSPLTFSTMQKIASQK